MSSEEKQKYDLIDRNRKGKDLPGTATFIGLRLAAPFVQYNILANGWGSTLVERLGGTVLPKGPPLVTNTPLDQIALSPYRSILLGMSVAGMLKQNLQILAIEQETIAASQAGAIGAFNMTFDTINSLLFVCSQTSASVNGEHFPQTPLIVGSTLFAVGLTTELVSELQRLMFKRDPANKGKIYSGGLFGLSRHINYFGYNLWRGGYALAAGGWVWGAVVAGFFAYDFTQRAIPVLSDYLEKKYGEQYKQYKADVPSKFVPFLY